MLEIILGIFGSGGFGSLLGLVGGLLNRKLDLEAKKIDLEDHKSQRAHDLDKLTKEREFMQAEYGMRLQVADKEIVKEGIAADASVEIAGYKAMSESYKFAAPTSADGWVDKFSKAVRPVITLAFLGFSAVIFWQIQQKIDGVEVHSFRELIDLYKMVIEWILFQAGVCIGWWFAMRPGRVPRVQMSK